MRPLAFAVLFTAAICCLESSSADAQDANKWTNPDGKEIVGEFVRMDGKAVILRLATGKEVKVPLASLSLESHLQALKLGNPEAFNKELVKAPEVVEPASLPGKLVLTDVLTSPFDSDPSIDSFLQTFTSEVNRGNLFVVWHMMPPKMQSDMAFVVSQQMQNLGPAAPGQIQNLIATAASIVAKKRDWMLDPSVTGNPVPEEQLEQAKKAWPYMVAMLKDLSDKSMWDTNNMRQENIPVFLASLTLGLQYLPEISPEKLELSYNIVSQSADRAEVQFTLRGNPSPVAQFQKVGNIWLAPELMNHVRETLNKVGNAPANPQASAMLTGINMVMLPTLEKLDKAQTKEEFKQALEAVSKMQGGGKPGMLPGNMPLNLPGLSELMGGSQQPASN